MVKREFSIQILTRLRILAMVQTHFLEHNTEQGGDVCTQIGTKKMCITGLCNDLLLPFFQTKLGRLDEKLIPGAVTLDNLNSTQNWGDIRQG